MSAERTTDDYGLTPEGELSRRIGKTWQSRRLKIKGEIVSCLEVERGGEVWGCILLTDAGKTFLLTGIWDKHPKLEPYQPSADGQGS